MDCLWYLAGFVLGLASGLYLGRLLTAIIVNWESTATAVKWSTSIIGSLFGAGGLGTAFWYFSSHGADVFYVLGLALGMTCSYFWPRMPARYTLESVRYCVTMSEALRNKVPDTEQRAILILTPLASPKSIERQTNISETELARRLQQAADTYGSATKGNNDSF